VAAMLPSSPTRVSCTAAPVLSAVTTSGGAGTGVGEGVATGVAVGARVGRAVGVPGLDPHAARPTAAIAVPMMVVSFMSPFTHSTGTRHPRLHPRKCVERPPRQDSSVFDFGPIEGDLSNPDGSRFYTDGRGQPTAFVDANRRVCPVPTCLWPPALLPAHLCGAWIPLGSDRAPRARQRSRARVRQLR